MGGMLEFCVVLLLATALLGGAAAVAPPTLTSLRGRWVAVKPEVRHFYHHLINVL